MTLAHILVFTGLALGAAALGRWLPSIRRRSGFLLVASLLAVFWLQPAAAIHSLDFWLPAASIGLAVLVWSVVSRKDSTPQRSSWLTAAVIFGTVAAIGATRYLGPLCCLTPSRPPQIPTVLIGLALMAGLAYLGLRLPGNNRFISVGMILLVLVAFLVLKTDGLARLASAGLRQISGQSPALASPLDLRWLGFSYLAFRLLHALFDYRAGRLPPYTLVEFVTYALFFPAFTAGPIDRLQHFVGELRKPAVWEPEQFLDGAWRILIGCFKKFALADSLALLALNGQNASQAQGTVWVWVMLYAYSLRIYFDFSGYTDIALGVGKALGLSLPENFAAPYLKRNLTAFWNSWHITLAQWFRAYFFNPLTRTLRSRQRLPVWVILLAAQLSTMLLIGLWHGVSWNFAAWGAWHGLGLFIHNRWTEWRRGHPQTQAASPAVQQLAGFAGWFLTFHFVALGWVWFALPDLPSAWNVYLKLFGL
jgi:D-alanyl-lipoteichoic acid acyltransferase DltB (MBOAT superfamily)